MKRYWVLTPVLIPIAGLAILFSRLSYGPQPTQAAHLSDAAIVVTTLEDELNSDSDCSLREAIEAANTNAAVDTCPAGDAANTDLITFGVAGTITFTSQLSVTVGGELVIDGGGVITTSGGGMRRAWWAEAGSDLTLMNLGIINGYLPQENGAALANHGGSVTLLTCNLVGNQSQGSLLGGRGGAIDNAGEMIIDGSTFYGNHVDAGSGGAIYNTGSLTLTHSILQGNWAYQSGGAIFNWGALHLEDCILAENSAHRGGAINNYFSWLTILESTFVGNSADSGGAIYSTSTVEGLGSLTISRTSLSNNHSEVRGGAISNYGTLSLTDSHLIENVAGTGSDTGGEGGGIYTYGTTVISNTTISFNHATENINGAGKGGGILNGGYLTLTQSTVSNNTSFMGGGILNGWMDITGTCTYTGTLFIENSTLADNLAYTQGGGIENICNSTTTLASSTLAGNLAASGGGIFFDTGDVRVDHTIIAASQAGGDCNRGITELGHNLDSDNTCGLDAVTGSLPDTAPMLGSLSDNGGATWTQALLWNSPAIDAGDEGLCPATDQRGLGRPKDGDGDHIPLCDIGAYEVQGNLFVFLPVLMK